MSEQPILAVGLLTARDIEILGPTFERLWPVQDTPCFSQLLQAIDEADRKLWRSTDQENQEPTNQWPAGRAVRSNGS